MSWNRQTAAEPAAQPQQETAPQQAPQAQQPAAQPNISDVVADVITNSRKQQQAQNTEETPKQDSDYYDEFESWGTDTNRDGVENPMADRKSSDVGKRNVKAYMYENPAVKPFFQEQAAWMLSELADSTKGERTYNEQVHYESGGEKGWTGNKRHTSESIAQLLDEEGMSYADIERGLNAIINDNGQENNAASNSIGTTNSTTVNNSNSITNTNKTSITNANIITTHLLNNYSWINYLIVCIIISQKTLVYNKNNT